MHGSRVFGLARHHFRYLPRLRSEEISTVQIISPPVLVAFQPVVAQFLTVRRLLRLCQNIIHDRRMILR